MAHNKVYAFCEDMCKEETMTKEQINDGLESKSDTSHNHDDTYSKLGHTHTKSQITDFAHNHDDRYYTESESNARYKLKGDFTTVSGSVTLSNGNGSVKVNYPSGFTKTNCRVVSLFAEGFYDDGTITFNTSMSTHVFGVNFSNNNISLSCTTMLSSGSSRTITMTAILMKV